MLATKALKYAYNNGPTLSFPDINCPSGEHWLLLGQSGSGKTTFLHLIAGLLTPSGGQIIIKDTDLQKLKGPQLDQFRGQQIGIIFQTPHFLNSLTVEENLALAQRLAQIPVNKNRIKSLLEKLNLGHKLKSKTTTRTIGKT